MTSLDIYLQSSTLCPTEADGTIPHFHDLTFTYHFLSSEDQQNILAFRPPPTSTFSATLRLYLTNDDPFKITSAAIIAPGASFPTTELTALLLHTHDKPLSSLSLWLHTYLHLSFARSTFLRTTIPQLFPSIFLTLGPTTAFTRDEITLSHPEHPQVSLTITWDIFHTAEPVSNPAASEPDLSSNPNAEIGAFRSEVRCLSHFPESWTMDVGGEYWEDAKLLTNIGELFELLVEEKGVEEAVKVVVGAVWPFCAAVDGADVGGEMEDVTSGS